MRILEFLVKSPHANPSKDELEAAVAGLAKVTSFNSQDGQIVLETSEPIGDIQDRLLSNFSNVKLIGQSSRGLVQASAVAIVGGQARGIVRLMEDESTFYAEGTISGLARGVYDVSINEYGDISNACLSTGSPVCGGSLGRVVNDGSSETKFVLKSDKLSISACIGRSLVVQNEKVKVACGIVGRSSGVSENVKKICACDGKVIWEEQVFGAYAVAPPNE